VYRMAQMHGGSIAVTSEVGDSSRFTVALPWRAADTDAEPIAAWTTQQELALARPAAIRRALIIDDSPTATNHQSAAYQYANDEPVVLLAEDNEANITTVSDYLAAHGYLVGGTQRRRGGCTGTRGAPVYRTYGHPDAGHGWT